MSRPPGRRPFPFRLLLALVGAAALGVACTVFLTHVNRDITEYHFRYDGLPNRYIHHTWNRVGTYNQWEVWLAQSHDHGYVVVLPPGSQPDVDMVAVPGGVELRFERGERMFVPADLYEGR